MKFTWSNEKLLRSRRSVCFAVMFVLFSSLVVFSLAGGDDCRDIEFGDALSNSRLSNDHVIRLYHVQNEPICRVKCFLEPDCVAYNYGRNNEGNLQCELCNKNHLQVPSNDLMGAPGFVFRPVAKNPCLTDPCPQYFTCQVGFRDQGYRCVSVCNRSLGMESGEILDEQITASSVWPGDHHAAHHGRLNFQEHVFDPRVVGSWSARKKDENQWLQVDLLRGESVVTSVATQGRNSHPKWPWGVRNQWVKNYKLQYSNNGVNFKYYKDQRQNSAKVFAGNNDRDSIVRHYLNPPIRARYIRFQPTAWNGQISMRVGLNGC